MSFAYVDVGTAAWTELPRGAADAVSLQNQGAFSILIAVQAAAPSSLTAAGPIIPAGEWGRVDAFGVGEKVWGVALGPSGSAVKMMVHQEG